MPCTLHIHGESVAITQDASIVVNAINGGAKLLTLTRQSDGLGVPVVVSQIGYVVPQPPAGAPATP